MSRGLLAVMAMAAIFLMAWIESISSRQVFIQSHVLHSYVTSIPQTPTDCRKSFSSVLILMLRSTRDAVLAHFDVVGFIKAMAVRDMDLCIASEREGGNINDRATT